MALHRYDLARTSGSVHTATRGTLAATLSDGSKAVLDVTLTDNPANTETLIVAGQTWTFVTAGAAGRQVNIAGSAALTAAAFVTAYNAHADGAVNVSSNPSGAIIRFTPVADSGTIAMSAFGTADQSREARSTLNTTVAVPLSGKGVTLIVDDSVTATKIRLMDALRALLHIVRKDFVTKDSVTNLATSGTVTD